MSDQNEVKTQKCCMWVEYQGLVKIHHVCNNNILTYIILYNVHPEYVLDTVGTKTKLIWLFELDTHFII